MAPEHDDAPDTDEPAAGAAPAAPAAAPAAGGAAPAAGGEPSAFSSAFDEMVETTDEPGAAAAPGADDEPAGGEAAPGEDKPDEGAEAGDKGKPPAGDKPAEGEEDVDATDETVPEGLSEKASARFREILEDRKQAREQLQQATGALSELKAWVAETGASPEEFQQQVERLRVFKLGKPEELKTLRAELLEAVADLTTRIGDDVPSIDVLAAHPDLVKEVENMTITRERALEIAHGRNRQKRQERTTEADAEAGKRREAAQAYQNEARAASTEIRKLEVQWKKTDPDADRKIKAIMANMEDFKFIPPKLWASTVQKRYEALANLAPRRPGATPPGQQPHTGGSGKPSGAAAKPTSLLGLMSQMED